MSHTPDPLVPRIAAIIGGLFDPPREAADIQVADAEGIALRDLGVNSLLLVRFINGIEDAFGVELSDADLDPANFTSVGSVCRLVRSYLTAAPGAADVPERATAVASGPDGITSPAAPAAPGGSGGSGAPDAPDVPGWLEPEAQLLLCTARPAMRPGHIDRALALLGGAERPLDWGVFLDLGSRHRVLGLVARNFDREHLGPLGTVRRSTLRAAYLYNRGRAQAWARERQDLLRAFGLHGLRPVVRKGSYLVQHVYADPAVRYMEDLDLYVVDDELPALTEVMHTLGYRQGTDSRNRRTVDDLDRHTEIFWRLNVSALPPFLRPTSDPYVDVFSVDPRRDLMEPASGKSVPAADFRARARRVTLAGEEAWVPGDEDMLLDLGVHLYREATTLSSIHSGKDLCLIRFVDVVRWLAHTRGTLDIDRLARTAGGYGVAGELYYSLHFTDEVFPGEVPTALLDALRPADLGILDRYGDLDGRPGRWPTGFMQRLFDRHRSAAVSERTALPRPRREWTDDHGAPVPADAGRADVG